MIVYASNTGNVESVVNKLTSTLSFKIHDKLEVTEPYFLFTYTAYSDFIPAEVEAFLDRGDHAKLCLGVFCSGNSNFGSRFCITADKINEKYNIPVLRKFELRGFDIDHIAIREIIESRTP